MQKKIAEKMLNLGPETVVVKLGSEGALAVDNYIIQRVKGYKVGEVVDSVGAGDGLQLDLLLESCREKI